METQVRQLTATLRKAEIRSANLQGRDYTVVPAVMLMGDMIISAGGSSGPELVPAEELAKLPTSWNTRPVLLDHPANGIAGEPSTIEQAAFGQLFGTEFTDNRLRTEVWIDDERVAALGLDVKERLASEEGISVSVGVSITLERTAGKIGDTEYVGIWRNLVPDHLAVLPAGTPGACSVSAGCGLNRTASDGSPQDVKYFISRMRQLAEGLSDNQIRQKLNNALNAQVLNFDWVHEVFQEDGSVIFTTWNGDQMRWWEGKFTIVDDEVELSGTPPVEGEMTQTFEPLRTATSSEQEPDTGETLMKKDDVIKRIIACECTPFEETHRNALEALEMSALEKLLPVEEPASDPAPVPEQNAAPVEPDANTPAPAQEDTTQDELPAWLPSGFDQETFDRMKAAADAHHALEAAKHDTLVANLSTTQTSVGKEALARMSNAELEQLERICNELKSRQANYAGGEPPAEPARKPRRTAYDKVLAPTEVN
jgi:hypothetical protein